MENKKGISAQVMARENVAYELRDKDGNRKKLFQDGAINRAILRFLRKYINPIENGGVKKGILNYLAAYGVRIHGITGSWGYTINVANVVTNAAKGAFSGLINGSGGIAVFASIGIGTGTTSAAATDTALQTEVTSAGAGASGVHAVAAATVSRVTTTNTNDTAQFVGTVSFSGISSPPLAVTESGVFNATTNGTMMAHQVFSAINVNNGDSLQLTWKLQFT